MTNADQIAREIAHKHGAGDCYGWSDVDPHSEKCDALTRAVTAALTEAHTAGFNEAKGRAVEIAKNATYPTENVAGYCWYRPITHRGLIATALQAMTPGGSDD